MKNISFFVFFAACILLSTAWGTDLKVTIHDVESAFICSLESIPANLQEQNPIVLECDVESTASLFYEGEYKALNLNRENRLTFSVIDNSETLEVFLPTANGDFSVSQYLWWKSGTTGWQITGDQLTCDSGYSVERDSFMRYEVKKAGTKVLEVYQADRGKVFADFSLFGSMAESFGCKLMYPVKTNSGTENVTIAINVRAALNESSCNRGTGDGCDGQTRDKRYYTINDDLSGLVRDTLFVPNNNGKPELIIQSLPDAGYQSFWGCGENYPQLSSADPINSTRAGCRHNNTLLGGIVYAKRLEIEGNGTLPSYVIQFDPGAIGNLHPRYRGSVTNDPLEFNGSCLVEFSTTTNLNLREPACYDSLNLYQKNLYVVVEAIDGNNQNFWNWNADDCGEYVTHIGIDSKEVITYKACRTQVVSW